jgi:hypothetical protein
MMNPSAIWRTTGSLPALSPSIGFWILRSKRVDWAGSVCASVR